MIDAKEREVLEKAMRINWVLWGAMLASIGVYILVAYFMEGKVKIGEGLGEVFATLRIVLLAIGIGELVLIPFIKRFLLRSSSLTPIRSASTGPMAVQSHPAVARYTIALIAALAIAESVAVYGLVLFFLGGDFGTLYLFTALGATGMVINRPKMDEIEHLAITMRKGGTI